jgi:2-polyprenyl-6-methoxyphenol hydroxylase-like FAD-dependent oxidoreductase
MSADVIVAGGGPVGLATAALLDAAAVSVEVFERAPAPSEHSKAITMHPRTLEVLSALEAPDGRLLSDVLVERGHPTPYAHFATLPQMLDYSDLPTPYPFVLMIPQVRTEWTLLNHLLERSVPVHYASEVTGFEQDAGGVRVSVGDTVHESRYLVGADGGHSLVRAHAGIDFPGSPPTNVSFAADVELENPPAIPQHLWRAETGSLSIVPLPDGIYRMFGAEPADTGLAPGEVRDRVAEPLTLEGLRAKLRRIAGDDRGVRSASWISRASDSTRHAAQYRVGRVLLAGDAAHVHLPAGGQGLNVGLQDAANLAWKLAAEIQGWAAPRLIEGAQSYERERQRVAELLSDNTLAQGALMNTFTPAGEALRGLISGWIGRRGDAAAELSGWLSGLGLSYPRPADAGPLAGTRAPDLALDGGTLLRALRPGQFVLADFSGEGRLGTLGSRRIEVREAKPEAGEWATIGAALIRPDGYVADAAESAEPSDWSAVLRAWTDSAG